MVMTEFSLLVIYYMTVSIPCTIYLGAAMLKKFPLFAILLVFTKFQNYHSLDHTVSMGCPSITILLDISSSPTDSYQFK